MNNRMLIIAIGIVVAFICLFLIFGGHAGWGFLLILSIALLGHVRHSAWYVILSATLMCMFFGFMTLSDNNPFKLMVYGFFTGWPIGGKMLPYLAYMIVSGLLIFAWTKTTGKFQSFIAFCAGTMVICGGGFLIAMVYKPDTAIINFAKDLFKSRAAIMACVIGTILVLSGIGFSYKSITFIGMVLLACWIGSGTWTAIFNRAPNPLPISWQKGLDSVIDGAGKRMDRAGKEWAKPPKETPPSREEGRSAILPGTARASAPPPKPACVRAFFNSNRDVPMTVQVAQGGHSLNSSTQGYVYLEQWGKALAVNGHFSVDRPQMASFICKWPCVADLCGPTN